MNLPKNHAISKAVRIAHPQHFRADLHEAKDLNSLVERMPAPLRVKWLRGCCAKYSAGLLFPVDVVRTTGETLDILVDFYGICDQPGNGLTLEWATGWAEHLLSKKWFQDALDAAGG